MGQLKNNWRAVIIGSDEFPDFTKAFVVEGHIYCDSYVYIEEFGVFTYINSDNLVEVPSLTYWLMKNIFRRRAYKKKCGNK